jgi:NADPH:quinone reductase-like Zn-dependent oxidoreductase
MRALRYERYGPPDVLHVVEVAEPSPASGEVKLRVRAASLNPLDWKSRAGHLRWVPTFRGPPRGTGCDFSGEIVEVGGGAMARFVGERVFGSVSPFVRDGAFAEFVVIAADRVVPIPDAVTFEVAAALPVAAGSALQALVDDAHLSAGQRVLVTGAAGGVGHFAVQIAKQAGAHVVGVCSAGNVEFVRSLGADEVVDYAMEDYTRRGDRFDVVFDAACASSFGQSRRVLTETGCYVNTAGNAFAAMGTAVGALAARFISQQRAVPFMLKAGPPMWKRLATLASDGTLKPRIERTIALEDVAEAQRTMETGHGRGKIVVRP